jgi:hypothetical protein
MNITNLQHLVLFLAAAVFYGRVPVWAYLTAAIVMVELDQARSYADPWWLWFSRPDTIFDLIAGIVGVGAAWLVSKL